MYVANERIIGALYTDRSGCTAMPCHVTDNYSYKQAVIRCSDAQTVEDEVVE